MADVIFATNALEACAVLSLGLSAVHKAAIATRIGKDPEAEDMKKLIAFDDLFALSVATAIVSDIPDIEQVATFVKLFMPRICFSQLFDYAAANLEAFRGWYRDRLFEAGTV
jgi:hypothetical protein